MGTNRKRVIVADDDPANRLLVREVLAPLLAEVIEAEDGRDAIEKIRENLPDLVLLDIQMPNLDGFAVLEEIRKDSRFASLPVIALTAQAMSGDRERVVRAGFDAHLAKPLNISGLKEAVKRLLD